MRKIFLLIALTFFCLIFSRTALYAQQDTATSLVVGVYVSPPFVMLADNGAFHGMAVELWETASKPLGISSEYIQYHSLKELLDATICHDVDVLLTNLSVTHERAVRLAISYPWFDGGMRLIVNNDYKSTVFKELLDSGRIKSYLWLTVLVIALTLIITLIRRRIDIAYTKKWSTGLAQSFHDLILAAKSGKIPPAKLGWIGYVLSAVWMLVGVALIAYVTSTLTSAMTSVSLQTNINSLLDLQGRSVSVGVISGSVGHDLLHSMGIATKDYDAVADAVNDLHARKLDAVVDDAPVLEYLAYTRPELELNVVGSLFYPEKYVFAANEFHHQLLDAVSLEIIKMHDNGELEALKNKFLGPQKP